MGACLGKRQDLGLCTWSSLWPHSQQKWGEHGGLRVLLRYHWLSRILMRLKIRYVVHNLGEVIGFIVTRRLTCKDRHLMTDHWSPCGEVAVLSLVGSPSGWRSDNGAAYAWPRPIWGPKYIYSGQQPAGHPRTHINCHLASSVIRYNECENRLAMRALEKTGPRLTYIVTQIPLRGHEIWFRITCIACRWDCAILPRVLRLVN